VYRAGYKLTACLGYAFAACVRSGSAVVAGSYLDGRRDFGDCKVCTPWNYTSA